MEEEEVLTDPKDPFSKYGGKQVSAKVTTTEPDPFAKYGGKLKKKEDTVSEPDSNDGSTQAGLDVSQEPGPKGAKPSGKSTESKEQELFNRYSADLEKGLLDLYSKKYKTEEDDFIKSIGGFKEPDLTNKDEVDSYNKKVNQLKEFQQKRGKEIDDEFKNHYETSTKSALERFNKNAIKKAERATEKSPASPFVEELKNAPRPISINPEKDARKIVSQFQTEITGKPESQGLVQDAYLAASNVPGAINKAFVSGMAATPKTVAMLAQKLDQLTGMPAKGIEEYATYQLGEYVENKAKELGLTVLQNPDYAGFMTSTLPQAVGSMLSMMLLGGRGATTNPFAAQSIAKQAATTLTSKTAMVGAMQASVPEFEAAKAAGKTDEEAFNVFLQNIPGGLTESVQMANMFGRLNRMTNNGLMNAIKLSTANGLEEASQEAIQQYLTNKVAQGSYDPERDLKEGMGEGAGAGFIVGFVMPGVMAAMDKMSPEQKAQTKAVLQKMLEQGYYVRTPESFRKTIKSPSQIVSEARTSVKRADDTQGAEIAAEKILEVTQSPNATEGQQLTTQTDGQERNEQGRQEGLLTHDSGVTPAITQRTDKEHADFIREKFVSTFTERGVPEDQARAAVALMDARAKKASPQNPDSWYRKIEDIGTGEFQENTPRQFQMPDGRQVLGMSMPEVTNGFYSPLEKTITESKQDKMPAKQWIEKFAKGEEAQWTGLTEWLGQQQGSVSKADIQKFLKENRVEIVEVVKSDDLPKKKFASPDEVKKKEDRLNELRDAGVRYGTPEFDANSKEQQEIWDWLKENAPGFGTAEGASLSPTKYSSYQTPGEKENYKEVLVTMPERTGATTETMYDDYGNVTTNPAFAPNKVISRGSYKSGHWEEPNILVHLRMNTRNDADGNKVLFLEEVQSDWGQEGKKKGFKEETKIPDGLIVKDDKKNRWRVTTVYDPSVSFATKEEAEAYYIKTSTKATITSAPFVTDTNQWTKLGLKVALKEAVKQGADKIAWTTGEQQNERYDLSKQVDVIEATRKPDGTYQVSARKDKQDIFNENGADIKRIEDVFGKDIAQKITDNKSQYIEIKGDNLKAGGKGMIGFYGNPKDGKLGIVGEVAKKLFKQEPKTVIINAETKPLEVNNWDGKEDISDIGGYDYIEEGDWIIKTPNGERFTVTKEDARSKDEAIKEFKRQSEEAGEPINFATIPELVVSNPGKAWNFKGTEIYIVKGDEEGAYFVDVEGEQRSWHKSFDEAKKSAEKLVLGNTSQQHSITITPELKRQVQEGQPLFQGEKGAVETLPSGKKVIHALKSPDFSTAVHEIAHVFEDELTANEKATIEKWAATDGWTTETSEAFARGFERYLKNGKAPSLKLEAIFLRAKEWLSGIYNSIIGSPIEKEITPEIKEIFDNLLVEDPDLTVGDNYVKRDNRWFVKDSEGIERPLISDNPNKTQEEQNTELAQLKELKTQLETETPVKVDLSPTGKSRIAEMEAFSPEGRVRKWLFGGGQLLWNSKSQGEGKPTLKGLKDETGYGSKERQAIKQYVHDTNGVSVEQAAEQLAAQYQDRSPQEYRNAIIEVFSSDPKKWYEQQVRDEDPDYAMQEEQRFQEAGQLNEQIKQLETQEEGIKETNQQLYENERRVNYGSPAAEGQAAGGQMASPGSGSQTQVQPRESIRKNGDANKSKQALEELKSKNLTHVPGLGMGANQAKGTYVSTEEEGSRYARRGTPVKVKVNVQNPFVSEDDVFYDIQREIIQSRFGKEKIEDLTETEADLLAEMVTEHFTTEGFDSIYMPQSETQEGELIVFDRAKVTIMDDARIEYENAVHASTQTTLQLEFVPDAEFLKTDKPIELREKQKKIRKDLARLNQLIKCR